MTNIRIHAQCAGAGGGGLFASRVGNSAGSHAATSGGARGARRARGDRGGGLGRGPGHLDHGRGNERRSDPV